MRSRADQFIHRHIGPDTGEIAAMASAAGAASLDALIDEAVPSDIRLSAPLDVPGPETEAEFLARMRAVGRRNRPGRPFIGLGYHGCVTPSVILRNVFENPGWYTPYTPYQAEVAQGRLEALLNFQTMVTDLTGMAIANASLLDEATAAAEAMALLHRGAVADAAGGRPVSRVAALFSADDRRAARAGRTAGHRGRGGRPGAVAA